MNYLRAAAGWCLASAILVVSSVQAEIPPEDSAKTRSAAQFDAPAKLKWPAIQKHCPAGIQSSLGDLETDTTPGGEPAAASRTPIRTPCAGGQEPKSLSGQVLV
jgi:hypothetical protein